MDLELTKLGKNKLRVDIWFANRKQLACLQTICGHIKNMFKGVLHVSGIRDSAVESVITQYFTIHHYAKRFSFPVTY